MIRPPPFGVVSLVNSISPRGIDAEWWITGEMGRSLLHIGDDLLERSHRLAARRLWYWLRYGQRPPVKEIPEPLPR